MAKQTPKKSEQPEAPKVPASFAELKEQNPNLDKPNLLALADHYASSSLKDLLKANHENLTRITELEEELRKAKQQEAEFVSKKEQIGQDWFPESKDQRLLAVSDSRVALLTAEIKAQSTTEKKSKKKKGNRPKWTVKLILEKLAPFSGTVDESLIRTALDCQSVDVLCGRLKAVDGEIKNADKTKPVSKISPDYKLAKPSGRNAWLVDVDLVKQRLAGKSQP